MVALSWLGAGLGLVVGPGLRGPRRFFDTHKNQGAAQNGELRIKTEPVVEYENDFRVVL